MGFVDSHKVNDVPQLAPSSRGHNLVHGKVDRMQDIAERLILDGRKKPVIAVSHPFKVGGWRRLASPRQYRLAAVAAATEIP